MNHNDLDDMMSGILGDEPSELQDNWLAYNPDAGQQPKAMAYGDHIRQRRALSGNKASRSSGNLENYEQTPDRRKLISHPPDISPPGVDLDVEHSHSMRQEVMEEEENPRSTDRILTTMTILLMEMSITPIMIDQSLP